MWTKKKVVSYNILSLKFWSPRPGWELGSSLDREGVGHHPNAEAWYCRQRMGSWLITLSHILSQFGFYISWSQFHLLVLAKEEAFLCISGLSSLVLSSSKVQLEKWTTKYFHSMMQTVEMVAVLIPSKHKYKKRYCIL